MAPWHLIDRGIFEICKLARSKFIPYWDQNWTNSPGMLTAYVQGGGLAILTGYYCCRDTDHDAYALSQTAWAVVGAPIRPFHWLYQCCKNYSYVIKLDNIK